LRRSVDPEDLVQSTLREAWQRREKQTFTDERGLRAWLGVVLRHKAVGVSRRSREVEPTSDVLAAAASAESTPSSILSASERPDEMRARMRMLDQRSQSVLLLRFVDGLAFARIGAQLGISEQNARAIFSRAVRELQQASSARAAAQPGA